VTDENELNLTYLKSHPLFPFSGYHEDAVQYMCLELYWVYLFKSIVRGNRDAAWVASYPPDKEREGNPIFSAHNKGLRRAVRVIHAESQASDVHYSEGGSYYPFQPFMSRSAGLDDSTLMSELCLVADLSDESEQRSRALFSAFCVELKTDEEMERMIREYEDSVGMPYPE
jgi:hypothetical protein